LPRRIAGGRANNITSPIISRIRSAWAPIVCSLSLLFVGVAALVVAPGRVGMGPITGAALLCFGSLQPGSDRESSS